MFKEIFDQVGRHFHYKHVKTTGLVFKLLTRLTVNILLCSAILTSMKQFFGEPINCQVDKGSGIKSTIETKCWIEGVYIDKNLLFGEVGKTITRWGVGPSNPNIGSQFVHQNYYQWIVPVFLLQALILYFPRVVWRVWENGLMNNLLDNTESQILTEGWNEKKIHIIRYLKEVSKRQHHLYVLKYIVCELMGAGALVFNMFLMQWVFNDFWTEFRPAISALIYEDYQTFSRHSALLFPTQAKCFYTLFGASGSIEKRDALCFLPQNTINEKIFVFLYFWLIAMLVLSAISLTGNFVILTFKYLRVRDLRRMSDRYISRRHEDFFYHYSDYGFWFILHLLHRNLSPVLFKDLITDLMKKEGKKPFAQSAIDIENDFAQRAEEPRMLQRKLTSPMLV